MATAMVQDRLRTLFHVWRERGFKDDALVCDLAADAMDAQAATIASLTRERDELRAVVERTPKTADGKSIYECYGYWSIIEEDDGTTFVGKSHWTPHNTKFVSGFGSSSCGPLDAKSLYSSEEAALAAREGEVSE